MKSDFNVAVIGAGPAGIAAGHELIAQGFDNFTVFDKSDAAGGTWHIHSYPGLDCDLWAHPYTFSYRPNPDWGSNFASRAEIEAYLQSCATEFGLDPHFRFNTNIVSARFMPNKTWSLTDQHGEQHQFNAVINAMGNQHTAIYPDVEGIESFGGDSWHSTFWQHDVDLTGKRVVVVGSAAAGVQIVPEVAKLAAQLTVLQRTPNWIMRRNRKQYSPFALAIFKYCPPLLRLYRSSLSLLAGVVLEGVTLGHQRMQQFEDRVHKFIGESITDPELRKSVTPNSRYGCKRGLMSDDFYPALNMEHVELVPEGLKAVRPHGITTSSGREIDADIIIYCTGYRILDFDRIAVTGLQQKQLDAEMDKAPIAYKGITVPSFPNLFFAAGPNGLAINASYFTNVELNIHSIVNLLAQMRERSVQAITVKPEINAAYNESLADDYAKYSWGHSSCNSYYRNEAGHAPFLFPGGIKRYRELHASCSIKDFDEV